VVSLEKHHPAPGMHTNLPRPYILDAVTHTTGPNSHSSLFRSHPHTLSNPCHLPAEYMSTPGPTSCTTHGELCMIHPDWSLAPLLLHAKARTPSLQDISTAPRLQGYLPTCPLQTPYTSSCRPFHKLTRSIRLFRTPSSLQMS